MSENLEDNEPRIIPPAVGNTQNEHVEPLIGTEHAPRVARSVSSDPEESALPSSGAATPVRPAPRRSAPRARRMSLSLTRVDAWSVAKVTFMLSIAVAIIQVVASAIVWVLLDVVGVFSQITQIVSSTGLDAGGFDLKNVLSLTTVVSGVIFMVIKMAMLGVVGELAAAMLPVVAMTAVFNAILVGALYLPIQKALKLN